MVAKSSLPKAANVEGVLPTGHRHIPAMRKRAQDPTFYISETERQAYGIEERDWARVTTPTGTMVGRAFVRSGMPRGLVRVPHGWWKPKSVRGLEHLSGAWAFSDAQITPDDDPDFIDREQGIPHMKGMPCALAKLTASEVSELEAVFGPQLPMPTALEKRARKRAARSPDFMHDVEFGRMWNSRLWSCRCTVGVPPKPTTWKPARSSSPRNAIATIR